MKKLLVSLLTVLALFALALAQTTAGKSPTAGTKKATPPTSKSKPMELKEREKFTDKKSKMSEAAGCNIANKGLKGQVCLYDIERILLFARKKQKDYTPVYVSPDNMESIVWYSSARRKFRIAELVLHTKDCPASPFAVNVTNLSGDKDKDKDKDEALETAIYSGVPSNDALGCEYKPMLKVRVKGKIETWDPHIIIGP